MAGKRRSRRKVQPRRSQRYAETAEFLGVLRVSLRSPRLNFLRLQTGIAIDPRAKPRDREWAEREIDESLRILPTPRQLADVLELTRSISMNAARN